ncbi:hypothetical protein TNCV_899011 [Trichonephila clavipes]|nr:hypothetical protein TNCV_899011 [Trichonephila clavipes]
MTKPLDYTLQSSLFEKSELIAKLSAMGHERATQKKPVGHMQPANSRLSISGVKGPKLVHTSAISCKKKETNFSKNKFKCIGNVPCNTKVTRPTPELGHHANMKMWSFYRFNKRQPRYTVDLELHLD